VRTKSSSAWTNSWAKARDLLYVQPTPRFFGFNNTVPSVGSVNYGYEVWMTIGAEIASDDTLQVRSFMGGEFAVTRVTGVANIFGAWQNLVAWVETSPSKIGENQCMEEHITFMDLLLDNDLIIDLYLPVQ
jgi:hypothetical protein